MLTGGYFTFQFATVSPQLDSAIPHHMPMIILFCTIAIAGLLWFEFYQIWRSRDRVASYEGRGVKH